MTFASARPARVSASIRLPLVRRVGVYAVAGGVWATGALWLLWRYFLRSTGPFGEQPSPLEPWWLKAHGLFAFAAIWTLGLLWGAHIVNGWTSGRRRWSGSALFGVGLFLTGTGYLLYYAGDERVRNLLSYAHWIIGLLAIATFVWHRVRWRRASPFRKEGEGN